MRGKTFLLCFLILLGLSPRLILAGGTNRSPIFGARAMGLNGLYYAGSDGISNIYLNPAGLAYKYGMSFEATAFFKSEQNSFNGDVRGVYNSIEEDDENFGLGFYWSIFENMTVGIAYESIFDFKVNWPYTLIVKSGEISNVSTTDMMYQEKFKIISPAISYKMGDLALGLSAKITRVNIESAFAQENYNWVDSLSLPVYQVDLKGNNWFWNINFGVMYDFSESFRVGLSLSNGFDDKISGTAESRLYTDVDSANSSVNYTSKYQSPLKVGAGVLYKLNEQLALNFDFRYNFYSSLDKEINSKFEDPTWEEKSNITDTLTGFSVSSFPQYFNNSIDIGIGLEYLATEDLDLVFGYRFSQSPNSGKTYSLLNPTVDQHLLSAGFIYRDNQMTLEGSLVYFFGISKNINNSIEEVHNGDYNTSGMIPTITLKYRL